MSEYRSLLTGFVAATVIGGGGGLALAPLSVASTTQVATSMNRRDDVRGLLVEDVQGDVEVLIFEGAWRRPRRDTTVERPTVIRTRGADSSITLSRNGVRLSVGHDARVLLGGAGRLALQLDAGRVLIHSRSGPVDVRVPGSQVRLSGEAFGVWARADALVTAVLDGDVSLDTASGVSTQYAKGREVTITPRGDAPVVMNPRLEVSVTSAEPRGRRFLLRGRTAQGALLLSTLGEKVERVPVGSDGAFAAESWSREPAPGQLVAYDAAGRRAEPGKPSPGLDEVLAAISKGAPISGASAEPHEAPAVELKTAPATKTAEASKLPNKSVSDGAERAKPTAEAANLPSKSVSDGAERAKPTAEAARVPSKSVSDGDERPKPAPTVKTTASPRGAASGSSVRSRSSEPPTIPVDIFGTSSNPSRKARPEPRKPASASANEQKKEGTEVELKWE